MNSLAIERTIETDLLAVLTAAGIAGYALGQLRTATATGVGIGVATVSDTLPGGLGPTGMAVARVAVDVSAEVHDDKTRAALLALVETVRNALHVDDLCTQLSTASLYASYYGWELGESECYVDGRRHHVEWSLSLVLRPGNSSTTTTTTTTT